MSYWKKTSGKNYQSLDNFDNKGGSEINSNEFYEIQSRADVDTKSEY